jgi:hypothetical protein
MDNLNLTETLTLTKWTDVRAASENTPFSGMSHGPPQKHLLLNPHRFRIQICGCTRRIMMAVWHRRCLAEQQTPTLGAADALLDPSNALFQDIMPCNSDDGISGIAMLAQLYESTTVCAQFDGHKI